MSTLAPALAYWLDQDSGVELPPFELTPLFSGGRTLAVLVRDRWRRIRRQALDRAGHRCEVCGRPPTADGASGERQLHVHEAWRYDLQARVQWLERLWVLCCRCHGFAHVKPCWNLEPRPCEQERERWQALVDQAWLEAAPRRLVVFAIDLQRGREPIPDAVAAAFHRADQASLPARIRQQISRVFDERLAEALTAAPFAGHRRRYDLDYLDAADSDQPADPGAAPAAADDPDGQRGIVTKPPRNVPIAVAQTEPPLQKSASWKPSIRKPPHSDPMGRLRSDASSVPTLPTHPPCRPCVRADPASVPTLPTNPGCGQS